MINTISVGLSLSETTKNDVKKCVLSELNRIKFTREIKCTLQSAFVAGFYVYLECDKKLRQPF